MFHVILSLVTAPLPALAQAIDCPINNYSGNGFSLPCWGAGNAGFDALATFISTYINPIATNVFGSLVFLMTLVYSISMIVGSNDENSIAEGRRAFIFAVIGGFVVAFQQVILNAVYPGGGAILNAAALNPLATRVRDYMTIVAAAAAVGFVTVRAIRLMTSGGDESVISSQRKLFLNAIIGVGVLLLVNSIVDVALGNTSILDDQIIGIADYLLFILGALAVLGIFIGGVLLIFSYDEALQERAKKSITAAIVIVVVLVCLGAIINLVL